MKVTDLFTGLTNSLQQGARLRDLLHQSIPYQHHVEGVRRFGIDLEKVETWMKSEAYQKGIEGVLSFIDEAPQVVKRVEGLLKKELKGEVVIGPSLKKIDGFARYDSGEHRVLIGCDYPKADSNYRKTILAHELSHVYREGTLLNGISRKEYLARFNVKEHLVSEGLAVLFSEVVYPEMPRQYFTFYSIPELQWCQDEKNEKLIGEAVKKCDEINPDEIWLLYNANQICPGSPPWAHYYWASHCLRQSLPRWFPKASYEQAVIEAHIWPTEQFDCF